MTVKSTRFCTKAFLGLFGLFCSAFWPKYLVMISQGCSLGATAFSKTALSITALSITALSITALSIMALSITALGIRKNSIMILITMALNLIKPRLSGRH
jgi:hypothetical protein